jgi:hypothetical protein
VATHGSPRSRPQAEHEGDEDEDGKDGKGEPTARFADVSFGCSAEELFPPKSLSCPVLSLSVSDWVSDSLTEWVTEA